MCGRFAIAASKQEMLGYLQEYFNIYDPETEYQLPRYNIAPNEQIPAVIFDGTQYRFRLFKWGFIPGFAKTDRGSFQMINAKAETITEKNAFKTAFQKNRCLIPISGFFEWQQTEKKKIPYYITLKSIPLFALAGIWSQYRNEFGVTVDTCALITAAATKQLLPIHHRMPVIIAPENNRSWLDCNTDIENLQPILQPFSDKPLLISPVSTTVNKPANDNPECIMPIKNTT